MKITTAILVFAALGIVMPAARAKPARIVSINMCSDELLVCLADPGAIAGITEFALRAPDSAIAKEAANFRTLRGNAEEVLALKPDLVFASSFNRRETVGVLRHFGVPVVMLPIPKNFDEIRAVVREVAGAIGEPERGEAVIRDMDARLARVSPGGGGRPTALFYRNRGFTAGRGTFEDAVIEAAGAINLAAALGISGHGRIPMEKLIAAKPDFLIFASAPRHTFSLGRDLLNHPAVRKGLSRTRVVTLPANLLNCGSPRLAEAVEILARQINAPVLPAAVER